MVPQGGRAGLCGRTATSERHAVGSRMLRILVPIVSGDVSVTQAYWRKQALLLLQAACGFVCEQFAQQ